MARTTVGDIDPCQLRIVIDELTNALINAVALGAYAVQGTAADATALDAAIRRATTTLRCLHLGQRTGRGGR